MSFDHSQKAEDVLWFAALRSELQFRILLSLEKSNIGGVLEKMLSALVCGRHKEVPASIECSGKRPQSVQ